MQQMGHGTMLDADDRPDETPPAAGGDATGARLAHDPLVGATHGHATGSPRHAGYFRKSSRAGKSGPAANSGSGNRRSSRARPGQ
jgi:hypothetical protein